jgi:2-hydroxychromene-2-carboxylate isomerase
MEGGMTSGSQGASVEFWFDPGCPYTWRTSRWLLDVATRRGLDVRWHLMSLSVLNEGREVPQQFREGMRQARRALRVLAAAEETGRPDAVGRLYSLLGARRHEQGAAYDDEVLRAAVAEAGLPPEIAAAADDESRDAVVRASRDAVVRASHDAAQRRVGGGQPRARTRRRSRLLRAGCGPPTDRG